jgi:predicted alpha/beta hydrolase family esterase
VIPLGAGVTTPILILPGINDSGPAHWQTHWERRLPHARRVVERDWDHPDRAEWVAALDRAVAEAGPGTVLVAHSLGCLQVAHWAAGGDRRIGAALLVAPPDPEAPGFPDVVTGFSPLPMMPLPFPSILVASTNDPYGTFSFATKCARAWGARLIDAGALGHINAESALGDWPEGLRLLGALTSKL